MVLSRTAAYIPVTFSTWTFNLLHNCASFPNLPTILEYALAIYLKQNELLYRCKLQNIEAIFLTG